MSWAGKEVGRELVVGRVEVFSEKQAGGGGSRIFGQLIADMRGLSRKERAKHLRPLFIT